MTRWTPVLSLLWLRAYCISTCLPEALALSRKEPCSPSMRTVLAQGRRSGDDTGWMADRWMDRPAPKSQACWQMEKPAHGWHCLEEETQEKPTWQYQLFTSAASTEGIGEKAGPGIHNPSPDPSPCHCCMTMNQSPGLSEPHFALLPRKGSHLSRPSHKSLWARGGPVSG